MKATLDFVLKSFVFTTIFWAFWLFVSKPINAYVAPSDTTSQASGADSQDKLMEKYWAQARLADQIQEKYLEQARITDQARDAFAGVTFVGL